jgi:nucleotide-binding universal stress UspA family protein
MGSEPSTSSPGVEVNMLAIRTVLCPIDLSPATARQIDVAVDVCRAFDARLVLHHNFMELAVGSGVGWMWAVDHSAFEREVEQQLRDLLPRDGVPSEVRLTHGPVVQAMLEVGRSVSADLVVLSTRGTAEGLDGSVTERVLEHASVPVLAIHDALHEHQTPRFSAATAGPQTLLVPTDLTPASQPALNVAFDLVRRFTFKMELLHVLPEDGRAPDAATADRTWNRLAALVPDDLRRHVHGRVERGRPARVIADAATHTSAACIVMGEHARTPLRQWFRTDTSLGVLHPAPCPVWYVPGDTRETSRERPDEPAGAASTHPTEEHGPPSPHLVDELRDSMFHYWPTFRLYGVVDSPEEAESTLVDLLRAGVPKDQLQTWYGPASLHAIDPTGGNHGRTARLWRALERATPERELLDRYAAEVEHGHVCIGIRVGAGEGRQVVATILQRHGGHLISYFSVGSVERLIA